MAWENKLYRAGKANGSYDMELFTQSQEQYDAKATRASISGCTPSKKTFTMNR